MDLSLDETDQLLKTFAALPRITRLEAGVRKSCRDSVDLAALLVDAHELNEALAEERGLVLQVQTGDVNSALGDRELLFQAVSNMLDNAIKYTPSGGTVILGLTSANGHVELWVADDGPGIPAAEREKVVQRFYRLESSRSAPGSGLGLSLIAAISRYHDATLLIEDNEPGLKVTLRFPRQADPRIDQQRPLASVSQGGGSPAGHRPRPGSYQTRNARPSTSERR